MNKDFNKDIRSRLKGKTLDSVDPSVYVSTGCYALNKLISDEYDKGIPLGSLIQLQGNSSTGKSLFATTFITAAQKAGWFCKLLDAENTFSRAFGEVLGIDSKNLFYSNPRSLEEAFADVQETIQEVRKVDKDIPMLLVLDSIAVLPTEEELNRDSIADITNTDGARRAVVTGGLLRKINHFLKDNNATLIVINQIRNTLNSYGNPETTAGGGRALEFYLSVDIKLVSNKTGDILRDGNKPIGIVGKVHIKKNKIGIPAGKCDFKVLFNKGLDPYYGLEELLAEDNLIEISNVGRRSVGDIPFKKNTISELLFDKSKSNPELDKIRKKFGISLDEGTSASGGA